MTAFFIKKYKFSLEKAINLVSEKRCLSLTEKFDEELKIWQKITLDFNIENQIILNRFVFRRLGNRIQKTIDEIECGPKTVDQQFTRSLDSYRGTRAVFESVLNPSKTQIWYDCQSCGEDLFLESDIVANNHTIDISLCVYTYTTPDIWIIDRIIRNRFNSTFNLIFGRIDCLNCNRILGEYNWRPKRVCKCSVHRGLDTFLVFRFLSDRLTINKKSIERSVSKNLLFN